MIEEHKNKYYMKALSVRGDSVYCPLAFSLDAYWNCLVDCWHCYLRGLNHIWGRDLRPANPARVRRQLERGLRNSSPKTPLAWCLRQKKTIRLGNKTDPFQPVETKHGVATCLLTDLIDLDWSVVIQTRFPTRLLNTGVLDNLPDAKKRLIMIMPVMSPGLNWDWAVLERERTETPKIRLMTARRLIKMGFSVGFNGEPFIPGIHKEEQFEETIKLLKEYGIPSYNIYNLHFTPFIARRLHSIGLDIERIWYYNQDARWRGILQRLIKIANKYGVRLGCPDFVNSGADHHEASNTCCGIRAPNPTTFNTHHWKQLRQKGYHVEEIIKMTWDGSGDIERGRAIINGASKEFYTLKDAGL